MSGTFTGYMRHIHDYGIFAELKTEVPADIADPQINISSLLKRNYDIALEGRNKLADEKSQATRSGTFEQTRKATLARLKKLKGETPIDLELRKMLLDQELDEFGRLYVESKHTIFGWKMDTDAKPVQGRLDFLMTPLPETSLDKSMRQIGREPSRFANVERSENSILSARMNLPLDEMRQTNLLELSALLLKRTGQNIDANKKATVTQKSARKSIVDGLSAMINGTTRKGLADGFIEAHSNDSNHNTLVAGFHFADGEAIVELLKKVPEARDGQQVEIDFDKEGSVRIHKLLLSADRRVQFNQFFGSTELYIGSEKEVVWVAAGENALSELKETIKKVAAPNGAEPNAPFADLFMHMAPWMQLRQQAAGRMGDPKLRKLAVDAFLPEDDTMTFRMERVEENQARGVITCQTGLLRLAGKILADFSKVNLDD